MDDRVSMQDNPSVSMPDRPSSNMRKSSSPSVRNGPSPITRDSIRNGPLDGIPSSMRNGPSSITRNSLSPSMRNGLSPIMRKGPSSRMRNDPSSNIMQNSPSPRTRNRPSPIRRDNLPDSPTPIYIGTHSVIHASPALSHEHDRCHHARPRALSMEPHYSDIAIRPPPKVPSKLHLKSSTVNVGTGKVEKGKSTTAVISASHINIPISSTNIYLDHLLDSEIKDTLIMYRKQSRYPLNLPTYPRKVSYLKTGYEPRQCFFIRIGGIAMSISGDIDRYCEQKHPRDKHLTKPNLRKMQTVTFDFSKSRSLTIVRQVSQISLEDVVAEYLRQDDTDDELAGQQTESLEKQLEKLERDSRSDREDMEFHDPLPFKPTTGKRKVTNGHLEGTHSLYEMIVSSKGIAEAAVDLSTITESEASQRDEGSTDYDVPVTSPNTSVDPFVSQSLLAESKEKEFKLGSALTWEEAKKHKDSSTQKHEAETRKGKQPTTIPRETYSPPITVDQEVKEILDDTAWWDVISLESLDRSTVYGSVTEFRTSTDSADYLSFGSDKQLSEAELNRLQTLQKTRNNNHKSVNDDVTMNIKFLQHELLKARLQIEMLRRENAILKRDRVRQMELTDSEQLQWTRNHYVPDFFLWVESSNLTPPSLLHFAVAIFLGIISGKYLF